MIHSVKVTLGEDGEQKLCKHLSDRIRALKEGWSDIHLNRLPRWRKIYEAIPREKTREFPWHDASNIVVPVVGIHSDTLLAWIMSGIFKTKPLWIVKCLGRHITEEVEPLRKGLETFLEFAGMEPEELDLYRVYEEWIGQTIRYGTCTIKVPWEYQEESFLVNGDTNTVSYKDFERRVVYDGPRPEVIPYEDFLIPVSAKRLESADIKVHVRRLQKWELLERRFKQVYDPKKVDELLNSPDRTAPLNSDAQQQQDVGAREVPGYGFAEWDIYECWLVYRFGDDDSKKSYRTRIRASFHEKTNTLLRCVYDNYPEQPFVNSRLFYRDGIFPGIGFCEMLADHQEEISLMHNQRRDRMTGAFNCFRVNDNSKLHSGYRIGPMTMLPAEKDEIEVMSLMEPGQVSIDEEQLALELAERRSGVRPPIQGAGSGGFNKKGVYSSQGTLAILQEGNTRTDLNVSDIRYAHSKLGRMLARQYAEFGVDDDTDRFDQFGSETAASIKDALQAIKDKRLSIPIMSSTASINREVEKQNDLMLLDRFDKHYQMITQMMSQVAAPGVPPEVKEYLQKAMKSANELMEIAAEHFGLNEPYRLVPEPRNAPAPPQQPPQQQQQQPGQTQQQPGPGMPTPQQGMVGQPSIPGVIA